MKIIFALLLIFNLSACVTSPVRDRGLECEVTCLDKNMLDKQIVRPGCLCEYKEDPERMKYENINLEPNSL